MAGEIYSTDPRSANYDSRLDPNSPDYSPEFEAAILADPSNKIEGPASTTGLGTKDTVSAFTSNGITEKQVTDILRDWQRPNIDAESMNEFLAWVTWYKQRYAPLFNKNSAEIIKGQNNVTRSITSDLLINWTAIVSAHEKVNKSGSIPDEMLLEGNAFIQAPKPYTVRINILSKGADGTGTPATVELQLEEASWNILKKSKLINNFLGEVTDSADGKEKVIEVHAGGWWDLKDALLNPDMLGVEGAEVAALGKIYSRLNGAVEEKNPYNPREDEMPALSQQLIKTGIAWSYDPITKRPELIDTMPWIGPSPASLRWIPKDPNNPTGRGAWDIDEESEIQVGKSLSEGVPASVRPWLTAVLDSGGDMSVIEGALPEELRNLDAAGMTSLNPTQRSIIKTKNVVKHWVGFLLGQARLASDPKYAKQPVSIPMGFGVPPLTVSGFDINFPNFVPSSAGGSDYGLGARAAAALGADKVLQAGGSWYDQWNKTEEYSQIGAEGRQGNFPPLYFTDKGVPTVDGTKVMSKSQLLAEIIESIKPENAKPMPSNPDQSPDQAPVTTGPGSSEGLKYSSSAFLSRDYDQDGNVIGYWDVSPDNLAVWINTNAAGDILSRNPGTSDRAARLRWLEKYGTEEEKALWDANYPTEDQENLNGILSTMKGFQTSAQAEIARLLKLPKEVDINGNEIDPVPSWMYDQAAGDFSTTANGRDLLARKAAVEQIIPKEPNHVPPKDAPPGETAAEKELRLAKESKDAADVTAADLLRDKKIKDDLETARLAEKQRLEDLADQPSTDKTPDKKKPLYTQPFTGDADKNPLGVGMGAPDDSAATTSVITGSSSPENPLGVGMGAGSTKPAAATSSTSEEQWTQYLEDTGQQGATGTAAASAYQSFQSQKLYDKEYGGTGATDTQTSTYTTAAEKSVNDKAAFEDYETATKGDTNPWKSAKDETGTWSLKPKVKPKKGTIAEGTGEL